MSSARRDRLEAYLATLRSPAQDTQKRRAANWPLYAAVTGSAMAMATNASVPFIANNIGLGADPNPAVAGTPCNPLISVRAPSPSIHPHGFIDKRPLDTQLNATSATVAVGPSVSHKRGAVTDQINSSAVDQRNTRRRT